MKTHARIISLTALCGILAGGCGSNMDFPSELVDFVPYPGNPIFTGSPGHWDAIIRERGWILREGDSWHMWYSGYPSGYKTYLGYATSRDGFSWERHGDAPLLAETWVEDMTVVEDGGTYYMFAECEDEQTQVLTSTDKVNWTRMGRIDLRYQDGSRIGPYPFGTPAVFKEGDTWYLLYERQDDGIWLATSRQLPVFTNVQDDPVITLGPQDYDSMQVALNQVIRYQGRYYAYYNGQGRGRDWTTNIAASDDLLNWEKYPGNPLFPAQDFINSSIVVDDGEQLRLYSMHTRVQVHFPRSSPAAGRIAQGQRP